MPNVMTVEQCINSSLRLLNQYSITGTIVPLTYNDSSDDVARMIDLINDGQMEIATVARPIHGHIEITVPHTDNRITEDIVTDVGALDTQFNHGESVLFTPSEGLDRRTIEAPEYKWIDHDVIAVPNRPAGVYRVEYQKFPTRFRTDLLTMTAQERADLYASELDNTPDTHEIIPYFVAAMVAQDQNKASYQALYNVWETRLARLNIKPARATRTEIKDVYGFSNFSGVW